MRIGIDARFYGSAGRGLGRYVSELIRWLERIDRENDYVVFLRAANFAEYEPENPRFTKVVADFSWYGWQEQLLYPPFLRRHALDLMHFPHFNVPLLYRRPFVVTVHDLILLNFPTVRATRLGPLVFRLKFLAYRLVIASALRRARAVLVPSAFVRDDIRKAFPWTKNKNITVTYEAASERLAGTAKNGGPLPQPYFLHVGSAYPHKNLETLLAAFQIFRRRGHATHRLTLVGAKDHFMRRLETEAHAAGLAENVDFHGPATDAELADIFAGAQAYVFPSLSEGFGLPPLEAMTHGTPVAASDATCLPEILGDAALYFNGRSQAAIAETLAKLADDENLRRELSEKGRRQAAKYDWRATAEQTLEAYRQSLQASKLQSF